MEKNLIGNSLSRAMQAILEGEISADDIGKIYASTCFTEQTMPDLLREYNFYWQSIARYRAEDEICQKYGVKDLYEIEDTTKRQEARKEVTERYRDLESVVTLEAEELLHNLWENGKIIQTRYRVPEGQTVTAKRPGKAEEFETAGDPWSGEVRCVNGQYYVPSDSASASLGIGTSRLFNSEVELLANQLQYPGIVPEERKFFMQEIFPQYRDVIKVVCEKINSDDEIRYNPNAILDLFNEVLRENGEHTAEEIGDSVKGSVTMEAMQEVLADITKDENRDIQQEGQALDE